MLHDFESISIEIKGLGVVLIGADIVYSHSNRNVFLVCGWKTVEGIGWYITEIGFDGFIKRFAGQVVEGAVDGIP